MISNLLNEKIMIRKVFMELILIICQKRRHISETIYYLLIKNRTRADILSSNCSEYYHILQNYFLNISKTPIEIEVIKIYKILYLCVFYININIFRIPEFY